MSIEPLRERHIDRVLSEELETSSSFATWFLQKVLPDRVPAGDSLSCKTKVAHHRDSGETDILMTVDWQSGASAEIHIEDKLSAPPQPDQGLRYSKTVRDCRATVAACVLVAPEAWIRRHPQEVSCYSAAVALEDIAEQLGIRAVDLDLASDPQSTELARRLRWRQGLLNGSSIRRIVYEGIQSGELTDWNSAAADVIAAANGLRLLVNPRQRSGGTNKLSRFFQFADVLAADTYGRAPVLRLKTASPRNPGRVSLDIPDAGSDTNLRDQATEAGFETSVTTTGTLLIFAATTGLTGC